MRLLVLLTGLAATSAVAQPEESPNAPRVEVQLSSFAFTPATVHLHAGAPVIIHLVNTGSGGHDFSAPAFFAAAHVAASSAGMLRRGAVEVAGHQSVDIALTPVAGHYPLRCTHALHSTFGMHGEIVVD